MFKFLIRRCAPLAASVAVLMAVSSTAEACNGRSRSRVKTTAVNTAAVQTTGVQTLGVQTVPVQTFAVTQPVITTQTYAIAQPTVSTAIVNGLAASNVTSNATVQAPLPPLPGSGDCEAAKALDRAAAAQAAAASTQVTQQQFGAAPVPTFGPPVLLTGLAPAHNCRPKLLGRLRGNNVQTQTVKTSTTVRTSG